MSDKLPMMPFWVNDWIAGTRGMSLAERGAYFDLLCFQWASGLLPAKPDRLARLVGVDVAEFMPIWGEIGDKFEEVDGGLLNRRLEEHRSKALSLKEIRANAGRRGGKATSKKQANSEAKGKANSEAKNEHPSLSSSPSSSSENTDGTAAPRRRTQAKPPDEFGEIREAYPKRFGGQRWTDAIKGYRRAIAQGHTHEQLLAAVRRYAEHCRVAGNLGTEKVQQAGTFFGTNQGYLEEWDTTPPKGSKQSAADEQKAEKERQDVDYLAQLFHVKRREGEAWESFRDRVFAANERRLADLPGGSGLAAKLKTGGGT